MPFCVQCGNQVGDRDRYCGRCGSVQAVADPPPPPRPPGPGGASVMDNAFPGVDSHTSSILCYIPWVGWVAAIFVLASQRFRNDRDARFHAFQGLYLFVAWLIVDWVLGPMMRIPGIYSGFRLGGLLKLAIVASWIWMLIKVSQRERFKLPVLGDLAEKSVAEQSF
jgi:uncharacterized membrane protein